MYEPFHSLFHGWRNRHLPSRRLVWLDLANEWLLARQLVLVALECLPHGLHVSLASANELAVLVVEPIEFDGHAGDVGVRRLHRVAVRARVGEVEVQRLTLLDTYCPKVHQRLSCRLVSQHVKEELVAHHTQRVCHRSDVRVHHNVRIVRPVGPIQRRQHLHLNSIPASASRNFDVAAFRPHAEVGVSRLGAVHHERHSEAVGEAESLVARQLRCLGGN
mmetsp:Transcript_16445/g.64171  ORF Transcript_16445/g.64171 Transcript_16445/m.64171 type:complete len:219 (-) Transcript_16445:1159-1815(-)